MLQFGTPRQGKAGFRNPGHINAGSGAIGAEVKTRHDVP